jgi:hypothetical protein
MVLFNKLRSIFCCASPYHHFIRIKYMNITAQISHLKTACILDLAERSNFGGEARIFVAIKSIILVFFFIDKIHANS